MHTSTVKTILLDKTALCLTLLSHRVPSSAPYVWRLHQLSSDSNINMVYSDRLMEIVRKEIKDVSGLTKLICDDYEKEVPPNEITIRGLYEFVKNKKKIARGKNNPAKLKEQKVCSHILAWILMIKQYWSRTDANESEHYDDAKTTLTELNISIEEWFLRKFEVLPSPVRCLKNTKRCPTKDLLTCFLNSKGEELFLQSRIFCEIIEQELIWMIESANLDVPEINTKAGVSERVTALVSYLFENANQAIRFNEIGPSLRAVAFWADEKRRAADCDKLLLRLKHSLDTNSCLCNQQTTATQLALGTMNEWNGHSKEISGFSGADGLLSFDHRLHFCELLKMRSPQDRWGINCRRYQRNESLKSDIGSIHIDNRWQNLILNETSYPAKYRSFSTKPIGIGLLPYKSYPIKVPSNRTNHLPYAYLPPNIPRPFRFRSLYDIGEDPLQVLAGDD